MERRTDSPYPRLDRPVLAIIGLLLVCRRCSSRGATASTTGATTSGSSGIRSPRSSATRRPDGAVRAAADLGAGARPRRPLHDLPPGDHVEGLRDGRDPYRTHPSEPLKAHPIERFGCTSCHGGQGWAIDTEPAHGPVAHWEEPLLSRALGEAYSLVGRQEARSCR